MGLKTSPQTGCGQLFDWTIPTHVPVSQRFRQNYQRNERQTRTQRSAIHSIAERSSDSGSEISENSKSRSSGLGLRRTPGARTSVITDSRSVFSG